MNNTYHHDTHHQQHNGISDYVVTTLKNTEGRMKQELSEE